MASHEVSNSTGILYVVATPIGNLDDISLRAIDILRQVDLVAAEDTRHSGRLLRHHGIDAHLLALHEHNEQQALQKVVARLQQGASVALISDAGTPLLSDPGFPLVRECRRNNITVSPIPGPSALLAALSVAGVAADSFCFHGFLARTPAARQSRLRTMLTASKTQIFYESSHRIEHTLKDMLAVFGEQREVAIARELTKQYEQVVQAGLGEIAAMADDGRLCLRGEFVVLVAPPGKDAGDQPDAESVRILEILIKELPLKKAVALAACISGERKNRLYQWALANR